MKKKIIVVAPHPDDETLGCGGTIAKRLAEGCEIFVIVMTDGRNAFSKLFGICSEPNPDEMVRMRRTEMNRAMKVLGVPVENILFLGVEDGKIEDNVDVLATKVLEILNELQPVEIYFPYSGDYHRDHRAACLILKDCLKRSSFSGIAYSYSVGQRFSRARFFIAKLFTRFRNDLIFVDVSKYLPKKAAAITEYESQTKIICARQKRPVIKNISKYLKEYETYHLFYVKKAKR